MGGELTAQQDRMGWRGQSILRRGVDSMAAYSAGSATSCVM